MRLKPPPFPALTPHTSKSGQSGRMLVLPALPETEGVNMNSLQQQDPEIFNLIKQEEVRQKDKIRLIASENYVSGAVMEATGSVLTNKYSEGYPGKRYYEGDFVDGLFNGKGVVYNFDGSIYKRDFVGGKEHGKGQHFGAQA